MEKLLRGKFLYLLLGIVVAWLYSPMIHVEFHRPKSQTAVLEKTAQTRGASTEAWPEVLDKESLSRLTKRNPLLALFAAFLSFITTALGLAGMGITLWALATGRTRRLWQFPVHKLPTWSLREAGRIVLLVVLVASLLPFGRLALMAYEPHWELDHKLWISVSMTLLDVFLILTILAFAEAKRGASAWQNIGFAANRNWASVKLGLAGYVTLFPWLFLLLAAIVEMANLFHIQPPLEPIHELVFGENRPWVFLVTSVLACLIGPLAEECFFRGILYAALRSKMSRVMAMLISGALFAGIHTNVIGFLPIMGLGCLLAYIYERSGSLAGSFAVHFFHNSLLMATALVVRLAGGA